MKKDSKCNIWILGMVIMFIVFIVQAICSSGHSVTQYLYQDITDSFTDFFSMLKVAGDDNIYDQGISYPPLAMLIFRFLQKFVPQEVLGIEARVMKENIYALSVYLIYLIINYISLAVLVSEYLIKNKYKKIILIYVILLSGPMIYVIQRGNILFLALTTTLFFCLYYDSENKYLREIAYISLAISAGIKIYPAIFGLLLLKEKKIKEAVRLTIYGVVCFVVPFIFYGGIGKIGAMFHALHGEVFFSHGFGYNVSFGNFIRLLYHLFGLEVEQVSNLWLIIPILLVVMIFLISKEKWKQELSLTLLLLWIPSYSYTYVLSFLIIPLVEYFKAPCERWDWIYSIFFVLLLAPGAWGYMDAANNLDIEMWFIMTNYMFAINIILLVFALFLLVKEIHDCMKQKERKIKC